MIYDILGYIVAVTLASMLCVSFVQLLLKKRAKTMVSNIAGFFCYALTFIYIAIEAPGWEGIGWILAGTILAGIHLIVLFIYSMKVRPKESASQASPQRVPSRPSPFSGPKPAARMNSSTPRNQPVPPVSIRTAPTGQAKSFEEFFKDDQGGELPFE